MSSYTRQRPRTFRPSKRSSHAEERQHTSGFPPRHPENYDFLSPRSDLSSLLSSRTNETTSVLGHRRGLSRVSIRSASSRYRSMTSRLTSPPPGFDWVSDGSVVSGMYADGHARNAVQSLASEFGIEVSHDPQRNSGVGYPPQSVLEDVSPCAILESIQEAVGELTNNSARGSDQTLLDQICRATVERMERRGRHRLRHLLNGWDAEPVPPYAVDDGPPPAYDSLYPTPPG
jgi:hypothetical protein